MGKEHAREACRSLMTMVAFYHVILTKFAIQKACHHLAINLVFIKI